MKALILASGYGKRLRPLTDNLPKQLIQLTNETILSRILKSLLHTNIREVIITTGHCNNKIEEAIKAEKEFKVFNISFVYNKLYLKTNYIYSLYLAKDALADNDVLLMHGDMVYDFVLLHRLLLSNTSAVLVNKEIPVPQKDFKAKINVDRVLEIGVNVFGQDAYTCMPIYKLKQNDMDLWMKRIDQYIDKGKNTCYAEDALNELLGTIKLHPLLYTNELCMEVDTTEDLDKARKLLSR